MNEPTEFQRGMSSAVHDLIDPMLGRDAVLAIAHDSEQTPAGLNSKFAMGYRRFAYHEMDS
jgi:hypothetical protein